MPAWQPATCHVIRVLATHERARAQPPTVTSYESLSTFPAASGPPPLVSRAPSGSISSSPRSFSFVSMAATAVAVTTTSVCASSSGRCRSSGPNVRPQAILARSLLLLGGRPSRLRTALAASSSGNTNKPPPGEAEEKVPAWAKPGADEPPPWAREGGAARGPGEAGQVPFYAYLLASAITAIAAIGSIFEYTNQRPVFGIVGSDSALYAPILGFFVFTGIPTSAFLWFKAVQTANREAEEQDRRDGFL